MPKESNGRHERSLNRFYVYALADPSNDEVFYIGKGSGSRVSMHAKLVRCGGHKNLGIIRRVSDIHAKGMEVREIIVWSGLSEDEAFRRESLLIQRISYDRLANMSHGVESWPYRQMRAAEKLLKVMPADWPSEWREHIVGMTQGKYLTPRELTNGMADVARAYWDGSWRTDSLVSNHA